MVSSKDTHTSLLMRSVSRCEVALNARHSSRAVAPVREHSSSSSSRDGAVFPAFAVRVEGGECSGSACRGREEGHT